MNMIKQNDKYYAFKLYNKYFADSSPSEDKYYIKVIDYDGTVIDEVNNLPNGTEYILPNPPSHSSSSSILLFPQVGGAHFFIPLISIRFVPYKHKHSLVHKESS